MMSARTLVLLLLVLSGEVAEGVPVPKIPVGVMGQLQGIQRYQ